MNEQPRARIFAQWAMISLICLASALWSCDKPKIPIEVTPAQVSGVSLTPQPHRPVLHVSADGEFVIDRSPMLASGSGKTEEISEGEGEDVAPYSPVIKRPQQERADGPTWELQILPELQDSLNATLELQRALDGRLGSEGAGLISVLLDAEANFEDVADVLYTLGNSGFDDVDFLVRSEEKVASIPLFSPRLAVGPCSGTGERTVSSERTCTHAMTTVAEDALSIRLIKLTCTDPYIECGLDMMAYKALLDDHTECLDPVERAEEHELTKDDCSIASRPDGGRNSKGNSNIGADKHGVDEDACRDLAHPDETLRLKRMSMLLLRARHEMGPLCRSAWVMPTSRTKWQNIVRIMATYREVLGIQKVGLTVAQ